MAILFHVALRKGRVKLEQKEIRNASFLSKLPARVHAVRPLFLAASDTGDQGPPLSPLPA